MKRLVIFFICSYFTLTVGAQITTGFTAGANLSTMSVNLRDLSTFRIKPKAGVNLNFIADIKLNSILSISSGVSFSQKGFKQTLYTENSPFVSAEMDTRLNYLEIPVYIKFNTNLPVVNFFYGAGAFFSYGLNGNISTHTFGTVDSNYTEDIRWAKSLLFDDGNLPETYGYTRMKRFDFGVGNMVGLKYKHMILTLDYRYSIKNIMWEYYLDEKMSNSVLSLSGGYIF
jgi:hypothetical protein